MTTDSGRPYLSIVVTGPNAERRIGPNRRAIESYIEQRGLDAEILVADPPQRTTILRARGRWILTCDPELSVPIEQHARLADAARDRDLDLVIGSRLHPDARIQGSHRRMREWGARIFNLARRVVLGLRQRDSQSPFRLFDAERLRPLLCRLAVDGYARDVELLYLCKRFDLKTGEIGVAWSHPRTTGWQPAIDGPRALLDLFRIRWGFRRGRYHPQPPTEPAG